MEIWHWLAQSWILKQVYKEIFTKSLQKNTIPLLNARKLMIVQ